VVLNAAVAVTVCDGPLVSASLGEKVSSDGVSTVVCRGNKCADNASWFGSTPVGVERAGGLAREEALGPIAASNLSAPFVNSHTSGSVAAS
jgi:hypothetical protein